MLIFYSDCLKGVELPINVMIIVTLALIVLIAIIALFFGVWNPGKGSITLEVAKNNACQMLISLGCDDIDPASISINDFDANKDGNLIGGAGTLSNPWSSSKDCSSGSNVGSSKDNLATLCLCYYSQSTQAKCRQICGCSS